MSARPGFHPAPLLALRLWRAVPVGIGVGCALFLAAACGGEGPAAGAVTVDTLDGGVIMIRSSQEGVWGGESPWRVGLRAQVGRLEGDGPETFASIVGLAEDALGRLWVLDRQAKELRVFTADGRHVRTVGRKGGGPGEFEDPASVSRGPGGGLWVVDWRNQRITVLDTAGVLVTEHRRQVPGYGWPWRGGFDPGGSFVDFFATPEGAGLLRFDPGMQPRDTLSIPSTGAEPQTFHVRYADGGQRMMAVPFAPRPSWTFAADGGFWLSPGAPYRLIRLDEKLDTLLVAERSYRPAPLSAREREEAEAEVRDFLGPEAQVDLGRIPAEKPAVQWITVDELGYVWAGPGLADGDPPHVDVFDPEGRYLGPLPLPVSVRGDPLRITADRIYGVHESELGVLYVVVLDLERADAR